MHLPPMKIGSRTFDFDRPYIEGILNVTPDSFSDGGRHHDRARAIERGLEMVREGADLLDIGGESTRPGAAPVPAGEELGRVVPVIRGLRRETDIPISIDTTKPEVAQAAVAEGADLINDISGLRFDPSLADLAARLGVPMVLMHSRKTPELMQKEVHYDDLAGEILEELRACIRAAVSRGVAPSSIIVDPGIGFAKTADHNLRVLADLSFLEPLGRPVMVGPSRKSFIGAVTGAGVGGRLGGTAAAVAAAVIGGANFLRVHDVSMMKQAADVAFAMLQARGKGLHPG
jgi:dihydropteroate synthase